MSRNRCESRCAWCNGEVVIEESPRLITPEDCGRYFSEFEGLIVAKAHCFDCEAKYLAWLDGTRRRKWSGWPTPAPPGENPVRDTSFRSTFDDEPGRADFPKYAIKRGIVAKIPWSDEVAEKESYAGYWRSGR